MTSPGSGYRAAMTLAPGTWTTTDFAGLTVRYTPELLAPRAWTAEQSRLLAELAGEAPPGPILELCCGAGHIGIAAALACGRELVMVDSREAAVAAAQVNAREAGVPAVVRRAPVAEATSDGETFPLVLADPPWVPSEQVRSFPEDPPQAIDGGRWGTDVLVDCLDVIDARLAPGGHCVLQVGSPEQVRFAENHLTERGSDARVRDVEDCRPGGLLVRISRPVADDAGAAYWNHN